MLWKKFREGVYGEGGMMKSKVAAWAEATDDALLRMVQPNTALFSTPGQLCGEGRSEMPLVGSGWKGNSDCVAAGCKTSSKFGNR